MFASYGFGLRKFFYFVCIGVTILISSIDASAASLTPTIHSLPTFGSWSDPNSWVEGRVPNSDDIVSIQGSIALDASYTVQGLVIEQGGLLSSSFATITSLGDIENNGAISIAGLISYGNITNSGGFSVAGLYLQGTGTSTLNFGNTTFTGTLALRTNISVIGDFKTTGQITLEGTNRTITLQDNHGITVGIGFYNGQLTVSGGTNSFLRTRGYTHTMIIDGNLDNFIFDGANSSLTPGDIYLCHGIITSKKATITEGSTLYHYPGCANSTIKTPLFHLEKDSLLDIRGGTYLFIEGGVFNEGSIFGGGGMIFDQGIFLDTEGNPYSYGNITNSGGFSVAGLYLQGTGTSTLNFGNTTFTGTLALRTNISVIGDFKTTGQITLEGTNRTITLQDNHGITVGIGFYNGQLTVSGGTNSFLRTRGYTHTMIIDGNLDNFIFDGANSSLTPGDIYLCHGIITSKKATITEGSTLYHYPGCANSTIKTPLFHLEKDSLLDIRGGTYLFIEGGVFNEGSIFGGGGIGISGDIDNKSTWTAPTYISWNPYIGASSYNIVFSPGFSTGYTVSGLSYDITDKIGGQYYWQVTPNNGESYPQRCINMGCISGGYTPIVNPHKSLPVSQNDNQLLFCKSSSSNTQASSINTRATRYSIFPQVYADDPYLGEVCTAETVPTIIAAVEDNKTTTTQSTDELDPVDLATGDFTYNNTLLHLAGNSLDYELTLQYRSRSVYDGPVGHNWDHNYNKKLEENTGGTVTYYDGKLGKYTFIASASGFAHMGGLNVDLVKSVSGTYMMLFDDGTQYIFGGNNKITRLTNKYNQSLNFAYNNSGALTTVTDTLGRTIIYTYDTTDHLTSVAESGGKSVEFTYYGSGETDGGLHDLKNLTIKNGLETKTIGFTYYTNTGDNNLDHNIHKLIDSKGQVYVENIYDTNDRVLSQKYGDDTGSYVYTLADIHEDDTPTTVGIGTVIGTYVAKNRATNRNGNVTEYTYNRMGNVLERATILQDDITIATHYNYDTLGRLTEEILPAGNGTKYAYDALGNKTIIRKKADMSAVDDDSADIVTRLTYSGSKNTLSELVDPLGKVTNFTTDTNGNITDITEQDASGTVLRNSQFIYDGQGNLIESTDARGAVTKMTYTDGRLMTQTRGYGTPDATTTSYTYDVYGNPLTLTDGRGNITAFTYDADDRLTQTLTPEGIVSEFNYDANNNKTRTSNAQLVADTAYNLLDKPTTLTADIDANQRATLSYTYDANENLLTTTYPNGQVETRTYDALDRLVQKNIQGSTTHTTSYTYDQNSNVLTETKDGQSTTFTYDGYDRLISATDANNTKTLLTYDKRGNILTTTQRDSTDTLIKETTHIYDTLGRITSSTEQSLDGGADRTTTYTYDTGDNILTMTDARSNTTHYTYDTLGRQATITLPSGLVTTSVYDDNSNIIESRIQHDGVTLTTTSTYDRDNRKTSSTDASGNTTHYEYNSLSQIVTVTDPSGVPTHYTYDYRGNIKTETRAGKTITKSYDVMGNLTSLTDANGNTTNYTYNGNNELVTETLSDGAQARYTYDTRGNIRTKTDPNGTVTTYTYDSIDRITRKDYALGVGVGGVTYETYTYDALGRLISTNNSASNQTSYTYDTLGNLITETSGGKTITYTYDAVGNKLTMQTPSGRTLSYTYDTMNRLTAVGESGTTIASYTYDGLNLTLETLANSITTNYGYDAGNRMSQVGVDTLTYDANSNITTKGIESYTYDIYNQLTETMYGNTRFGTGMQGQAYEYDLMGNRINEQNIRIVTRTNKKTGTTTEIQRNKVWNYTTNGLNQYTDVLTQSGTILVSTGVVDTNTGTTTNTGVTSTGGLLTDSGSTNTGTTDTESSTDTGATSTGTVETSTPEILSNTGTITDTGATSTGDTLETNTGTTEGGTGESSTGSTTPEGESGTGEVDSLSIPETNTGTTTDTGSTDTENTVTATLTGDTDTTTMLIASDIILADTGSTNTGVTTDTGATTTDSGAVTDTGTLTDTGVVDNPIVDTGALQGRLLYDKNGNIIGNTINNKREFEYIYDAQNRMIQVNRYNDVTGKEVLISFTYDPLGRRTSKKVANVIYEYIYSGNDVIEEVQSNVNPTSGVKVKKETREYTYGPRGTDDIVSVRFSTYTRQNKQDILSTTGNYYYEKNHLGSIIRITSSTGVIVDEYSYTVFGKAYRKNTNGIYKPVSGSNDSPIGNTRLFTGREYDREVSLYYLRARYYDANLGRFISRDPIGIKDDVNLYTYVVNSPLIYKDPTGTVKLFLIDYTDAVRRYAGYVGITATAGVVIVAAAPVVAGAAGITGVAGLAAATPALAGVVGATGILGLGSAGIESVLTQNISYFGTEFGGFIASSVGGKILTKVGVISDTVWNSHAMRYMGHSAEGAYGFVKNEAGQVGLAISTTVQQGIGWITSQFAK